MIMMEMNVTIDSALVLLLPSFREIKVAVAASVFAFFAYLFFTYRTDDKAEDRSLNDNSHDKDKVIFVTLRIYISLLCR
ncbi:hypothetical protein Lalb_Chr16g0384421 [Lupinus albus]|uniref:Uncharacterized protein n=1 Tax=Lupinus albus TaxID=3870 RepID=A0A6A4P3K1_LUPAL|nr:hypothetical protein Lalb_Chr16g0384421 [Lupinus albus]